MILALIAVASCHVGGVPPFVVPENQCTPGAYQRLTLTQVCTSKDRPSLPAADRRRILANYGVPNWTGADGELDHRVPFYLGGTTTPGNLWPERGTIPNPKDRLETYTYQRVCRKHTMRARTAIRIFLANWIDAYTHYFGSQP